MKSPNAQLMKLPDELLLIILKKLDSIGVLSLLGFNKRLDRIIRDPCLTTEINLVELNDDDANEQANILIDRFCLDILPKIDHLIRRVKVRSTSMERILMAADYPNLFELEIFLSHEEPVLLFNGE